MKEKILELIPIAGFVVSLMTLCVWIYAVFGPLAELQKNVAAQNYSENIDIQFNYPDLKEINSWNDPVMKGFMQKPVSRNEQGEPVYQAQFCVLNAPNNFSVETFIFKRYVPGGAPNLFPQMIKPIELLTPNKGKSFVKYRNRPRIFKLDMVITDQNPATIIINVLNQERSVIKSGFYHFEQ
jgi:hypothetical protein